MFFSRSAWVLATFALVALYPSMCLAQTVRIEVTIDTVHDVPVSEGAVCGFTEYYGKIRFNHGHWTRTHRQSVAPGGGGLIYSSPFDLRPFGWAVIQSVTIPAGAAAATTRVDVQVWEYDEFPCGGDDQLDIAPSRPKTVTFNVVAWPFGPCLVTDVPGFAGIRGAFTCGEPIRIRVRPGCGNCRGVTLRVNQLFPL